MKPQKITLQNNKQKKLVGYLYKGSSKTLIVACHGIESSNNVSDSNLRRILPPYWSEISLQTNASVFSLDFSGYGESEGENSLSFKQRDADLKTVIDYFSPRYKNIILYGFSMGGLSAAIAALKYKEITGLITVNGFFTFNPTKLLSKQLAMVLAYLFANPRFGGELHYWMKHLKGNRITVPTLVIYSNNDPIVTPKQSTTFYNKLKLKKQLVSIKSNDHALEKEHMQIPPKIAEWLKKERIG